MTQIETIASDNQATRVASITLGIGPLSGIEERLLKHAFPVASAGSVAEGAELLVRTTPVRVKCSSCDKESTVKPNRLVCGYCNDWRTDLVSGDELLLIQVELDKPDGSASPSDALQ